MCFEPRDYLRHILVETDYLIGQGAGLTAERFMSDEAPRLSATYVFFWSFAQVSRNSTVRLKTSFSALLDLSAQKYPRRSN